MKSTISNKQNFKNIALLVGISILFLTNVANLKSQNTTPSSENLDYYEELTITGKIIDEYTNTPVEFVNLIVVNTLLGTAADEEGNFSLTIPRYYSENSIYVSAIGYTSKTFVIKELLKVEQVIIELKPTNYEIEAIVIKAASKSLYGLLRKSITTKSKNYISGPYNYNFILKNKLDAGSITTNSDSKGIITDSKGYVSQLKGELYKSRSYTFTSTNSNFNKIPFKAGLTNMDELLNYDIVRSNTSIFSPDNLYEYQLELVDAVPYENDTLMHLAFKNLNPTLITTNDAYIKYYEGDIYLLKNKCIVVKCIIRGSSAKKSIHGKSFFVRGKDDTFGEDIQYVATINYHTNGKEYHLNTINLNEEFTTTTKFKGRSNTQLIIQDHSVLDSIPEIKTRDYFNNPSGY